MEKVLTLLGLTVEQWKDESTLKSGLGTYSDSDTAVWEFPSHCKHWVSVLIGEMKPTFQSYCEESMLTLLEK